MDNVKKHPCEPFSVPKSVHSPAWGQAIYGECDTDEQGRLIVGNDEYSSPVDFCPWCGFKGTPWPKEKK